MRAVHALIALLLMTSCGRVGFDSMPSDAGATDVADLDQGMVDAGVLTEAGLRDGAPPPADASPDAATPADWHEITAADDALSDCPRLAVGGGLRGVAWRDARGPNPRVYFRTLSPEGAPTGAEVAVSPVDAPAGCPGAAAVPGGYAVAWAQGPPDGHDLWLAFLSAAGTIGGAPFQVESGGADSAAPSLTFDGTRLAIAWDETRGVNEHIEISLVDPMSMAITPLGRQSDDGLFVRHVDIVPIPGGFAHVHYRWSMGGQPAQIHTLSVDGSSTGGPVPVGEAEGAGADGIGLGFNGRTFAVAFVTIDPGHIDFARFASDLTPLAPPLPLAAGRGPAMAVDGAGRFGVTYADGRAAYLAVLTEDGVMLAPPRSISAPDRSASHGDIAHTDAGWLVTWAGGAGGSTREVRAALIP